MTEYQLENEVGFSLNGNIIVSRFSDDDQLVVFHRPTGSTHILDALTGLVLEVLGASNAIEKDELLLLTNILQQQGLNFDQMIEERIKKLIKLDLLPNNSQTSLEK